MNLDDEVGVMVGNHMAHQLVEVEVDLVVLRILGIGFGVGYLHEAGINDSLLTLKD